MEFLMDMVHHNPGEKPFDTSFLEPKKLKSYGYNAQVFKHINTALTLEKYDSELWKDKPEAKAWMENWAAGITAEIKKAKQEGLKVYYHIDLFVLPKAAEEKYHDQICDSEGKISLRREKTLEIHRALFDELFERFPDVDGLIVRVGETYLHDTPYHVGNGAVKYGNTEQEKDDFVLLLNFLREEICEKHDRYLFFRTWDCFPDRFHANAEYYLDVTNRVETHPKLLFSIKHTALDFWRRVKFNDCLTLGKHRQIVEVQCQREYEGKGAYPSYVMNGVINSFDENREPKGLRDIANHPLVCGLYTWSRGGGWYGPYPKQEFWCDLNTYVIAQYGKNPFETEESIFLRYAQEKMGLAAAEAKKFRELCLLVPSAVLKGRYIECYDRTLNESIVPCCNWMRDDRMGGLEQLAPAFEYLYEHDLMHSACLEKQESVLLWKEIKRIFGTISFPDTELKQFIGTSIDYAIGLYTVAAAGWQVMALGFAGDKAGAYDTEALRAAIRTYDTAWEAYREVGQSPYASTLYHDEFLHEPGIGATVDRYRNI